MFTCEFINAASTNAWEQKDVYVAPNFESFFPDDTVAGARLDDLERNGSLDQLPPDEMISAVQKGLRRSKTRTMGILRSLGNRFIWGRHPQNAAAIELMYHASAASRDIGSGEASYCAVYFGLSVTDPKTPNILRTLADICMHSDDPNMLSRVAWGVRSQQADCVAFLTPFLESSDEKVKDKAHLVKQILTGKINAFEWATEEARKKAAANFSGELPEIKRVLGSGTSQERRQMLDLIQKNRLELIMDESFIPAFAACVRDIDARVRSQAVIVAGYNWVWNAKQQSRAVIDIMLQSSYDPAPEVRYNAVYYGLSTIHEKSDAVVHRLMEMTFHEDEHSDLPSRISWGLMYGRKTMPQNAISVAAKYLKDPDPKIAARAASWYRVHLRSAPPTVNEVETSGLNTANLMQEIQKRLQPPFQPFVVKLSDGQTLLISKMNSIALGEQVMVLMEAGDHIHTVPLQQIAEISAVSPNR